MSSDITAQIKDRLDIVEVVSRYVKLEPAGTQMKGRSPFTTERTPSFFVSPDKGLFHCFSTGKGGDIFSFIQEVEGVDFKEALKILADIAGVALTPESKQAMSAQARLHALLDMAARWYEVNLRKTQEVVTYMLDRGVDKDSIKKWQIGFAPEGWSGLTAVAHKHGWTDVDLQKSGLGIAGKKGTYDRFRDRVMFPICDARGRVVGFTGRIFVWPNEQDNLPEHKQKTGKYVNSPETAVYHKSNVLFGYHLAKQAMSATDRVIITEGQFDCVLSHQAGAAETIALSGTILSDAQIKLIKRFTTNIIFALDADTAGVRAIVKSVTAACAHGCNALVIPMPQGMDPADIVVNKGAQAWLDMIDTAMDVVSFLVNDIEALPKNKREAMVHERIYPLLQAHTSPISVDRQFTTIAHVLGVSAEAVREDFMGWRARQTQVVTTTPAAAQPALAVKNLQAQEVLFGLVWLDSPDTAWTFNDLQDHYKSLANPGLFDQALAKLENDKTRIIFETTRWWEAVSPEGRSRAKEDVLTKHWHQHAQAHLQYLRSRLHQAELSKNDDQVLQILAEIKDWSARIDQYSLSPPDK